MARAEPGSSALLGGSTAAGSVAGATAILRGAGIPTPRLDAELDPAAARLLAGWVERRATGEPVAYIRGFKEWLSLRIATDARALIPRPETELLAEAAISEISARLVRDDAPLQAWDVATGSGAVALAVALRFRTAISLGRLQLAASDLSAEALELASENLAAHRVSGLVTLACGDLLEPAVAAARGIDLLIANLPYLTSTEAEATGGSIDWEPRGALDGGRDGLDLLRRLIVALPQRLSRDGVALLEIGAGQADAVRALVAALDVRTAVTTLRDLSAIERVVRVALV